MSGINRQAYKQALLECTYKSLYATLEYFFQCNPRYKFKVKEMIVILGLIQRKMIEQARANGCKDVFLL